MTEATRFYSVVAPKNSDRPYARQLVVGDEWHPPEGEAGDVKVWNGTAWADKAPAKTPEELQKEEDAAEAESVQRDLEKQKQREADEQAQRDLDEQAQKDADAKDEKQSDPASAEEHKPVFGEARVKKEGGNENAPAPAADHAKKTESPSKPGSKGAQAHGKKGGK